MKRGEIIKGSAWALITGASSGIGLATARRVIALGYNIIIAGNRAEELDTAAELLRSDLLQIGSELLRIECITIDLATEGAAERLFERSKSIADVDLLVNNAGVFSFLDILECPTERIERIVYLHDMTTAISCKLFAADMVQRRSGGYILNLASYSLWMPFPGLAIYGASKAFVRNFSVAFSKEVDEFGIKVTAVCPAGVATDLYGLPSNLQRLGIRLGALITADSCARRSLNALWRGKRCIVPDWWNRLFIPLCLYMPMFITRILRRKTMKIQR